MREVSFPDYSCTGAHLACQNRGYEYVRCQEGAFPAQMKSANVTCVAPTLGESLTRTLLSGVVGAAVVGGLSYAIRGDEKSLWQGAAVGGAMGLLFGGYV